jgi:hypothetical protein
MIHDHIALRNKLNRQRHNPAWLIRMAQWIGKLRTDHRRYCELRKQGFSDNAIKGQIE